MNTISNASNPRVIQSPSVKTVNRIVISIVKFYAVVIATAHVKM